MRLEILTYRFELEVMMGDLHIDYNYNYRIYSDRQQIELLSEWLETCRASYNYALGELKDWIASRKCPIDRCSLESEYIIMAKGMLGKHTIDAGFGQQRTILEYVARKRDVFVGRVDRRVTSQCSVA